LYHKNGKSHKNISLYLKRIEYKEKNIKIGWKINTAPHTYTWKKPTTT
jgi:hypothetical protein